MQIRLNRPQSLAHQRLQPGNSLALPWGRGIGKSWFERQNGWFEQVARWDGVRRPTTSGGHITGVRIVHMMPTFKQCRDVHEQATRSELEGRGPWSFLQPHVDHVRWLITFPGGSSIQWFGAREANGSRGIRCDTVTVDEADDVDPEVLDAVVDPWFSEPWSLRQRVIGGTPRRGRYGLLYREHKAGLDGDVARRLTQADLDALGGDELQAKLAVRRSWSFHATWREAPETVDPIYVAQVRAKLIEAGKKAVYEREWECNFDSAEGLVYSMFEEALHVRRPAPGTRWSEILVGVDHGWEDPGVMLVIGVVGAGRDAICHILEEVYEPHRVESWWVEQAKRIRTKYNGISQRWFGDPSQPARNTAIGTAIGIRFSDQPADRQIETGVSALADRMAPRVDPDDPEGKRRFARLYIDPGCTHTRWELVNYRRKRDPRNVDRFLDDIEDKNNHAADSCRYAIYGRFGSPQVYRSLSTSL